MSSIRSGKTLSTGAVAALFLLHSALALAAPPGNGPLISFGNSVLAFLTGTLGPIVFGIGLAIAAISLVMGSREGISKAIYTIVGGALLFSVGTIVTFVQAAAGR